MKHSIKNKTKISHERARSLLFPIAAFLLSGGMDANAAQSVFASAIAKAQRMTRYRRIQHIGRPAHYAEVISIWAHDKRFVGIDGAPRPLKLNGENQFKDLLNSIDPNLDPSKTLKVLMRYGNVRRGVNGKYTLVKPFFFTSNRNGMAFEPIAYFLSDASATLGKILTRRKTSRGTELFWRKVETAGLSNAVAREFTRYVGERSLAFLEELDDWLESRRIASKVGTRESTRRVGLGLFSIHSDPEGSSPR